MKNPAEVYASIYVILGALVDAKPTALKGVPNGHLYTTLMDRFDIHSWTGFIMTLKGGGLLTESNHLLRITEKGEKTYTALHAVYTEAAAKEKNSQK